MAQKTYGIDFGTDTIKIYKKGQGIILLEKNVVSTVGKERRPVAIGEEAFEMFEKVPPSINVSFPLSHGVVSKIDDMIALWSFMGSKIARSRRMKGFQFYIAVPADITEVEKHAYSRIVSESDSKPKKVCLIDKPIADAYGLGLDVEKANGILIVNIGADTTEISVLSLGGIVVSRLLPYGGKYFDDQIKNYIRKQYNFVIGLKTAEQIKKKLVSAFPTDGEIEVMGRDVVKGLPGKLNINASEIFPLVNDVFYEIAVSVKTILERTPHEISHDIVHNGVYLTGGSSWISGLDQLIANETFLKVNTTRNAQKTVVTGLGYLAEHPKLAAKYAIELK